MPVLKIYKYGSGLLLATTLAIYVRPTICDQETGVAMTGITLAWILFGYPMLSLITAFLPAVHEK